MFNPAASKYSRSPAGDSGPFVQSLEHLADHGEVILETIGPLGRAIERGSPPADALPPRIPRERFGPSGRWTSIDALADQTVWHRVVRASNLNIIIGMTLGFAPAAELIRAQG
jgi:hypothetical protein